MSLTSPLVQGRTDPDGDTWLARHGTGLLVLAFAAFWPAVLFVAYLLF